MIISWCFRELVSENVPEEMALGLLASARVAEVVEEEKQWSRCPYAQPPASYLYGLHRA